MAEQVTANEVYERLIKPNLSDDLSQVMVDRKYVKPEMEVYLRSQHLLVYPEGVLDVDDLLTLDKLGWVSDETRFTLENRLVVPIRNAKGEVITLVGWRKGRAKYLTLPSPNFSKESHWFNIHNALERSFGNGALPAFKGTCVVVEGIFDALSLDRLGIPCVATMGATITPYKGALLGVFDRLVCIPDSDAVGKKALERWSVPQGVKFLMFRPTKIDLGDGLGASIKDIDDLCNFYDDDAIRELILDTFSKPTRVSYIDLD